MSSTHQPPDASAGRPSRDGFTVLDACHRQTLVTLEMLDELMKRLQDGEPDVPTRAMAKEIAHFFSNTARQHHEDEERHIFPAMLASTDPEIVQTVQRLQQDHRWLEEDWIELGPQIDAVAGGQSWVDLDIMREWVEVFSALSHDHVELEESCIYPQARERLGAGERREMGREMAARRRRQENQN